MFDLKPENLPFNWVDLAIVIVLLIGMIRGKKRGLSEELLDVFLWLTIIAVAALLYQPIGDFLADFTGMGRMIAYIGSYIFVVVLVKLLFGGIKRMMGEKLVESDMFGRGEYYLGMLAGGLRFACVILAVMALLHARLFTAQEIAAQKRVQEESFGSIRFPTWGSIQHSVFKESVAGQFVEQNLNDQLIASTPFEGVGFKSRPGRRREKMVDEIIDNRQAPR